MRVSVLVRVGVRVGMGRWHGSGGEGEEGVGVDVGLEDKGPVIAPIRMSRAYTYIHI